MHRPQFHLTIADDDAQTISVLAQIANLYTTPFDEMDENEVMSAIDAIMLMLAKISQGLDAVRDIELAGHVLTCMDIYRSCRRIATQIHSALPSEIDSRFPPDKHLT